MCRSQRAPLRFASLLVPLSLAACATAATPTPWATPVSDTGPSADCAAGDAPTCERLMVASSSTSERLHYGSLACDAGSTTACEMSALVASAALKAPTELDDTASLTLRLRSLNARGCEQGSWWSCIAVAKTPGAAQSEWDNAVALSDKACFQDQEGAACLFQMRSARRAKDSSKEWLALLQGCRSQVALAHPDEKAAELDKSRLCSEAKALGATPADLAAAPSGAGPASVEMGELEKSRIGGEPNIHPPNEVAIELARTGKRVEGELSFCVSEAGHIDRVTLTASTGHPGFDRKLIEGVAGWRYRPHLVDGAPVRVCGRAAFSYTPQ